MPRLLLAPAGYGKTENLVQRIRQLLADEPFAPVVVVAPNMIQAAGFRQRLSASGGALGVEVHTFHTLYAELLTRAGQPIPLLLDPVRMRLLRDIVDDLCEQGKIRHYAALRDKPGFIALLRNAIEELKRARIFPEDFSVAVTGLEPRLQEIALVYDAYQNWLQKQNWADNEGRGWLAAIALESNPKLGADTRLLAVSGFDEFNPTQLGVLSLLAQRAKETLITLTGDVQRPQRPAHHRFWRAQTALTASLGILPEAMDSTSMLVPSLAQVEAALFEKTSEVLKTSEVFGIEFLEAQTRAAEARAALRWIKARIVRDGLKLTDAAVLARDLEPYRAFLEETAAEFGIPLRLVGGQPLVENPAIAALLGLLSLPVDDWTPRPLLDAWRSPYFDWTEQGISPAATATLDKISRSGRVMQGLAQWREAFALWKQRKVFADQESDGEPLSAADAPEAAFEAFVASVTPPDMASIRQYVAFVESLIGDDLNGGDEKDGLNMIFNARANPATAERDVAALRAFKDVLRGLVLAEATLGTDSLTYADFYNDLRSATESATYSFAPLTGLMAASVLDARGLSLQAVAVLGLSEGEFPKQEREDILLRESDRVLLRARGLPLETRLHGDEATFFYQAVTRARQRLLLTRPYLAEDGQPWEPSPFWVEMRSRNGNPAAGRVRPEDGLDPAEAASPVEWQEAARDFDISLKNGVEVLKARMNPKAEGVYEGQVFDLSERFGASHGWSASRLESYGTCAFEFFIAHALGLEPRALPEEGYDVRALGSMLHKILEEVYGGARLAETAQKVFATAPQDYGFRPTPLWKLQQDELLRAVEKTIRALDELSVGHEPRYREAKFGMGAPSLVLQTGIGEIRLHGYIDRMDVAPDGSLRVIDYKSGNATISAAHLKEGRRLQLPIYALAARDALGLGRVSSGFYWHIQKAEASSLKLEKFEGGVEAAFETAVAHVVKHVANIRAGHFEPKAPAEGCPSYCPAVGFCWRYKKGF
ncbi:MAG: PD-(D/E)XK nuclease family protein [Anaerolineales bacterium]